MNTAKENNIRQIITHTTATRIPAVLRSLIALLMLAILTVSAAGAEGLLSSMTVPVIAQGSGSFFDPEEEQSGGSFFDGEWPETAGRPESPT